MFSFKLKYLNQKDFLSHIKKIITFFPVNIEYIY